MELLRSYNDGSNTPKGDRSKEDSVERSPHNMSEVYTTMMESRQPESAAKIHKTLASSSRTLRNQPGPSTSRSNSDSNTSDDDSASEMEDQKKTATLQSSESSDLSSASSSPSASGRSDVSKKSPREKEVVQTARDRKMSSGSKVLQQSPRTLYVPGVNTFASGIQGGASKNTDDDPPSAFTS